MNIVSFLDNPSTTEDDTIMSYCPHHTDKVREARKSPPGAPANRSTRCGARVNLRVSHILDYERMGKGTIPFQCPACGKTRFFPTRAHRSLR